MGVVVLLAACAVALLIDYLIAKEFYSAAIAKGYSEKKYLWICFFLTAVGYLLVIALPDRGGASKFSDDELPAL